MLIALDYDGTITADDVFWCRFVRDAIDSGHQAITVTHRRDTFENRRVIQRTLGPSHPIIFAYDKPKKLAAIEAGFAVDVWIDDNPHGIGDGTENTATQSVFQIELQNVLTLLQNGQLNSVDQMRLAIERIKTVLGE